MKVQEQLKSRSSRGKKGRTAPVEHQSGGMTIITESQIPALNGLPRPVLSADQRSLQQSLSGFLSKYIDGLATGLRLLDTAALTLLVDDLCRAREENRQIFILGNGGSAAVASHLANDLGKQRFDDPRYSFRVLSLTDNVPWITATANDFGYDHVFVNQLKNLLQPGDLVISISSSGNSKNVLHAVDYANERGARTWGLVGFEGGALKDRAQQIIYTPSQPGQYGYAEDISAVVCHMVSIYITERDAARYAEEHR